MPAAELLALGRADEHDLRAGRTERFDWTRELTVFELVFDQDCDAPLGERWSRLARVSRLSHACLQPGIVYERALSGFGIRVVRRGHGILRPRRRMSQHP